MKPMRQGTESNCIRSITPAAARSSRPMNFSKTIGGRVFAGYKKLTKKGFLEDFFLASFFVLLVIGFALSFLISNSLVNYFVGFLAGLVFSKACYHKSDYYLFHYVILSTGFAIGYVIGTRSGNYFTVFVLFVIGLITSFYLHKKGIL